MAGVHNFNPKGATRKLLFEDVDDEVEEEIEAERADDREGADKEKARKGKGPQTEEGASTMASIPMEILNALVANQSALADMIVEHKAQAVMAK